MSDKTKIQVGVRNALLVIFGVLLIDQWSKIYVKLNFTMDEEVSVFGDWFILHFTENPGMAFGMEFGGEYGKLALTLFRILAVSGLGYYLFSQIKSGATMGYILCLALITAGASGNIIDSIFYGMYFSESTHYELATAFPETGYAAIFHGRVVDMLYLPIFKGFLPEWLGGDYFIFFRPIFNIADASISIGVFLIMIFQKRFFSEKPKVEMEIAVEEIEAIDSDLNAEQLTDDKKKN
jgi:signal peptidase II